MKKEFDKSKVILYIVISFVLWIITEFLTVWSGDGMSEWVGHMPWVFIQYLVIILVFVFFIFKLKWSGKKLFWLMIVVMFILEIVAWQNFSIFNPLILVMLIQMWGFLSIVPLWIVNKSIKQHKKATIFYCLWPVVGYLLAVLMGSE